MMTSVSQARSLAGCRAFGSVRPRVAARIANGTLCHMARKDSYMVEVEVAEDEPEDVAVRRYMKLVMQSRVVEKLRARKVKETKIEEYKRRFRERVEMRKAGIVEPTYEELYSSSEMMDRGPFDDFFSRRDEEDPEGAYDGLGDGLADDIFGNFAGGYVDRWTTQSGGYMSGTSFNNTSNWQGGYM
ncbi:plastid/chloroplast ribosomal protein S21 [Volvox carteri f. nagariensis]|uniref:Plastid/chloroplast ribosomal protein S21 n=1 Tax=Volvox carteri f. nagariensis TaxID=3068 RepID=D8UDE8_VOLCA|nr:plastid/chloroplast ribosomal protein S21 [Volvox carteri f. nagariensis]EFJ42299.1 plastid/chloroplast ribosomal protein S21 [Volvox carteri f. nagariensis]|eukprot:XP_002956697.1 plastid/chloroplast ribosomal protein S21 [Volvox carteri f. nagariensis]